MAEFPEMPHAGAAAVTMIKAHAADFGLRRHIKKQTGDIGFSFTSRSAMLLSSGRLIIAPRIC
jgi:hypothetical protein